MVNIKIDKLDRMSLHKQPFEICERKGLGHPDTICDSVMNQVSIGLCNEYQKRFGTILHHNVDKSLLAAGASKPNFNGGKVYESMKFVFGDRATFQVGDEVIPVEEIAVNSAKQWLKENIRFIDPEDHVVYQSEIRPGAISLQDVFARKGTYLGANDTSATVGYAPFTPTENLILELEQHLNSPNFKKQFPESGEDIKLMGLRNEDRLDLTVAMAFVDRFVKDEKDYFIKKEEIKTAITEFITDKYGFTSVDLSLNALDAKGRGLDGLYMTVLGTSADAGDSGQVGRGNNVMGVIPLNRPTSAEAAAGKNPISHVGKIYNLLGYRIAGKIVEKVDGVQETNVWLLSQIGKPINEPRTCTAQIITEKNVKLEDITPEIEEAINYEFEHLSNFCDDLANGKITVC